MLSVVPPGFRAPLSNMISLRASRKFAEQRALVACNGARAYTLLSLCRLARGVVFLLAGTLAAAGASSLADPWEKTCLACADICYNNYTIVFAESKANLRPRVSPGGGGGPTVVAGFLQQAAQ